MINGIKRTFICYIEIAYIENPDITLNKLLIIPQRNILELLLVKLLRLSTKLTSKNFISTYNHSSDTLASLFYCIP
jgi:hypothetical protein